MENPTGNMVNSLGLSG